MDERTFNEIESIVLRHYADRNARNVDIFVRGQNVGGVTVMLDNGSQAERYYLGTVDDVLAGKLPDCKN